MVADQRFAASRPDVLVYQSEPLEDDVTLAGPVTPKLFVSTTGTDADWVVKLIDVYPHGLSGPERDEAATCPAPTAAHGRLPAAGARRSDARQVPQQLREAGAVRAGQGAKP